MQGFILTCGLKCTFLLYKIYFIINIDFKQQTQSVDYLLEKVMKPHRSVKTTIRQKMIIWRKTQGLIKVRDPFI